MIFFKGKVRRAVQIIFLVFALVSILSLTVGARSNQHEGVSLIPFISFVYAIDIPEYYRSMLMNVWLFLPFGLCMPYILPDKIKRKVLFTVLIGFVFSFLIEFCQLVFRLGKCETDDVIMNTLGAFIGATSYWLINYISKKIKTKKENK